MMPQTHKEVRVVDAKWEPTARYLIRVLMFGAVAFSVFAGIHFAFVDDVWRAGLMALLVGINMAGLMRWEETFRKRDRL
jgi:hypothetical protein